MTLGQLFSHKKILSLKQWHFFFLFFFFFFFLFGFAPKKKKKKNTDPRVPTNKHGLLNNVVGFFLKLIIL